ncbi:aspartyl protease family protein [bacterium]|nr:aspartyl protease family protein [bacterium]
MLVTFVAAWAGDVEEVLLRHRESLGIEELWESLETIQYTGTIASGGMGGTTTVQVVLPAEKPSVKSDGTCDARNFVRGIIYRSEVSLGPLHELVLITPEGGWIVGTNGEVRGLVGVELQDYTASLVMDSLLYCYPDPALFDVVYAGSEEVDGVFCDVLDFGPVEGGLPFHPRRFYLDGRDGSLRRITSELDKVAHVTDCSELREFSGLRVPTRFTTTLSGLPLEFEQTTDTVVINGPVDMGLFLRPVGERLAFPEGISRVRVPVEFVGDAIFVPVVVNGERVPMILDTGATMSVLSTPVAEELGIVLEGTEAGVGAGGLGEVHVLTVERLEIGGLTIGETTLAATDLSGFSRHFGREWGGILGYELFARTVVEIDYGEGLLTLYDPEVYTAPEPEPGIIEVLPLGLGEGLPTVEAEFDGIRGPFAVDLGNLNYTAIYHPAVVEYGLQERYPDWRTHLISGFGGMGRHRLVRLGWLRLGSLNIASPLAILASDVEGALARSRELGNIGQDILKRFRRVTLDYPGERLILEMGADGLGDGIAPNRLGFCAAGDVVVTVWEDSPAERAGLREGDIITSLEDEPFENLTALEVVEWTTAEPGTPRVLTVLRGVDLIELHLTTEELW